MRTYYDGYAQGSTEYIIGTSLEALCRFARVGAEDEQDDNPDLFNEGDYDEY
jgi:hypothetical protein